MLHMAQQRLGTGKIVQTHQMHGLALTMQILNEGLALQQVAKSRQVDDQGSACAACRGTGGLHLLSALCQG